VTKIRSKPCHQCTKIRSTCPAIDPAVVDVRGEPSRPSGDSQRDSGTHVVIPPARRDATLAGPCPMTYILFSRNGRTDRIAAMPRQS
jgi:hypothetical protein